MGVVEPRDDGVGARRKRRWLQLAQRLQCPIAHAPWGRALGWGVGVGRWGGALGWRVGVACWGGVLGWVVSVSVLGWGARVGCWGGCQSDVRVGCYQSESPSLATTLLACFASDAGSKWLSSTNAFKRTPQ